MSDALDWLVPFAACTAEGCRQASAGLALPNLQRLLARLEPTARDSGEAASLSPPHERVLAARLGLAAPDGCLPWAAHEALQRGHAAAGQACAWISPCRWQVGTDHVRMEDPAALELDAAASRELLAVVRPYFAEDGIALHPATPLRWLAQAALFDGLATASVDRVIGVDLDAWMPRSPGARLLRRLQSEMQMLLYTHAVSEARAQQGLPVVNSFWVSGSGSLPPDPPAAAAAGAGADATDPWWAGALPAVSVPCGLRSAALRQDWASWAEAWRALDRGPVARLLAAAERGAAVRLTLCGERSAQTFEPAPRSLGRRLAGLFGRAQPLSELLEAL